MIKVDGSPYKTSQTNGRTIYDSCEVYLKSEASSQLGAGVSSCSSLGWPAGWPHLYWRRARIPDDRMHDWV